MFLTLPHGGNYSLFIYVHFVEFIKISTATAVGFAVMGFIGFFVRLIHIPVNSILLGTSLEMLNYAKQSESAIYCEIRNVS